jgi:hypothetical protein
MAPLKPMQAQYVTDHACGRLRRLKRPCERLQARGFVSNDPRMRAALQARNAVHGLRVHSMYAAMPPGTAGNPGTRPIAQSHAQPGGMLRFHAPGLHAHPAPLIVRINFGGGNAR